MTFNHHRHHYYSNYTTFIGSVHCHQRNKKRQCIVTRVTYVAEKWKVPRSGKSSFLSTGLMQSNKVFNPLILHVRHQSHRSVRRFRRLDHGRRKVSRREAQDSPGYHFGVPANTNGRQKGFNIGNRKSNRAKAATKVSRE